jgi:hypothetical protein
VGITRCIGYHLGIRIKTSQGIILNDIVMDIWMVDVVLGENWIQTMRFSKW